MKQRNVKSETGNATASTATATATAPAPSQTAQVTQTSSAAKQKTSTKQSGKPVVNRSVRVDIEKLDVLMNLVSELIIAKNGLVASNATEAIQRSQSFNEQIEYLEGLLRKAKQNAKNNNQFT